MNTIHSSKSVLLKVFLAYFRVVKVQLTFYSKYMLKYWHTHDAAPIWWFAYILCRQVMGKECPGRKKKLSTEFMWILYERLNANFVVICILGCALRFVRMFAKARTITVCFVYSVFYLIKSNKRVPFLALKQIT